MYPGQRNLLIGVKIRLLAVVVVVIVEAAVLPHVTVDFDDYWRRWWGCCRF